MRDSSYRQQQLLDFFQPGGGGGFGQAREPAVHHEVILIPDQHKFVAARFHRGHLAVGGRDFHLDGMEQ